MDLESDLEKISLQDFSREHIDIDGLAEVLLSTREIQDTPLFFGGDHQRDHFEECFNKIVNMCNDGTPLYMRWRQNTDGKIRNLSVPKPFFKEFLQEYLLPIVKSKKNHESCHGGEKGWSPKKSLEQHLPVASVLSFDLSNAFENFPMSRVYSFFQDIFTESSQRDEISLFLALLCTVKYSHGRGLPTGSNLSMALFNRGLYELDERIYGLCRERSFRYARWVDDLTISSSLKLPLESFFGAVVLTSQEYPVSKEKTYFQESGREIFLLGYKITSEGELCKNSKEEKIKNKIPPLNYEESIKRGYEPWI